MAGITSLAGPEVICTLPHKERLIVGQTYAFEVFGGAGTDPNACEFTIDPDEVLMPDRVLRILFAMRAIDASLSCVGILTGVSFVPSGIPCAGAGA